MVSNRLRGVLRDNLEAPEVKTRNLYLLIGQRELLLLIQSQQVIHPSSNVEDRT